MAIDVMFIEIRVEDIFDVSIRKCQLQIDNLIQYPIGLWGPFMVLAACLKGLDILLRGLYVKDINYEGTCKFLKHLNISCIVV